MPEQFTGIVEILNSNSGAVEITLNGGDSESNPSITVGGGEGGSLVLRDSLDRVRIGSNADTASTRFRTEDGEISVVINGARGDIRIGGGDRDGNLLLFNENGDTTVESATIHLDGGNSSLELRSSAGTDSIFLGGEDSTMLLGNTLRLEGDNGRIVSQSIQLLNAAGGGSIFLGGENSTMLLGNTLRLEGDNGSIVSQSLQLRNSDGGNSIFLGGENSTMLLGNTLRLDGEAGDIILQNADCAEEFDISEEVEPGTVMVLDAEGKLRQSVDPYDKKVAGVISGAGGYKPGIVLDRQQSSNIRMPVALMGKVYCKVDAQYGAIEVGDLLTTSSTPGHAMKVNDSLKAFGTVIGKALLPFAKGQGLISILVTLQ